MKNEPAFPCMPNSAPEGGQLPWDPRQTCGMTLLDYAAIKIFTAMRSSGYDNTREVIAEEAVKDAKALLAALEKESHAQG